MRIGRANIKTSGELRPPKCEDHLQRDKRSAWLHKIEKGTDIILVRPRVVERVGYERDFNTCLRDIFNDPQMLSDIFEILQESGISYPYSIDVMSIAKTLAYARVREMSYVDGSERKIYYFDLTSEYQLKQFYVEDIKHYKTGIYRCGDPPYLDCIQEHKVYRCYNPGNFRVNIPVLHDIHGALLNADMERRVHDWHNYMHYHLRDLRTNSHSKIEKIREFIDIHENDCMAYAAYSEVTQHFT